MTQPVEKLDAALQIALKKGGDDFNVFIHTQVPLDSAMLDVLGGMNVRPSAPLAGVYSGTLSRANIDKLAPQTWVRHIRLSQLTRPT